MKLDRMSIEKANRNQKWAFVGRPEKSLIEKLL